MASGQPKRVSQKGKNPLNLLKLTNEEWNLFNAILPLLQRFRDATLDLEGNKRPLLFEGIRYMDGINKLLESYINDTNNPPILRWGAALGLAVLDKYYAKTDSTMLYKGAMSRLLWKDYYKPEDGSEGQKPSVMNTARKSRFLQDDDVIKASSGDVFEDWVLSEVVTSAGARNPILWWSSSYMNEDTWSEPLQCMALDILSCPATSCDAEHGFSCGGLMVTKRRYALSSSVIRASLCLLYWAKVPGLILEEAIMKMFNDKGKCHDDKVTVKSRIEQAEPENNAIEAKGSSTSDSE
ncbi:hypothetical protein V5O48_015658 [Marasmius crinis-equi]|uniref:HAT C-terminal dimerisation domain-containing protein n=1 Tax=Marasmius crinis-equi TaxID=585013 RepID=A0ABR3ETX3_9AGAR